MYIISGAEKFEPRVANRTVAGHVVKEIIVRDGLRVLVAPEPWKGGDDVEDAGGDGSEVEESKGDAVVIGDAKSYVEPPARIAPEEQNDLYPMNVKRQLKLKPNVAPLQENWHSF